MLVRNENKQEYIWKIPNRENITVLALLVLVCPGDVDLSCNVIVSKVSYKQDEVTWEKIGIVNNDNWDIIEWRKSGIRNIELWYEEDWNKYGYSFNIYDLWDKQWENWISGNWKDEEKRRLYNYVHKYFNTEGNVDWFGNVSEFIFNKQEYLSSLKSSNNNYKSSVYL